MVSVGLLKPRSPLPHVVGWVRPLLGSAWVARGARLLPPPRPHVAPGAPPAPINHMPPHTHTVTCAPCSAPLPAHAGPTPKTKNGYYVWTGAFIVAMGYVRPQHLAHITAPAARGDYVVTVRVFLWFFW